MAELAAWPDHVGGRFALFTSRLGSEVLVDFVGGDIDRPLVVGQFRNGSHELPWPAGVAPASTTSAPSLAGTTRTLTAKAPTNGWWMTPPATANSRWATSSSKAPTVAPRNAVSGWAKASTATPKAGPWCALAKACC